VGVLQRDEPHYVLLVGIVAVSIFLGIEARRYRGYHIWRTRVRVLQENVWAYALDEERDLEDEAWREKLARDYVTPQMKVSPEEAVAHRLRRVYLALFGVLALAWIMRITAFSGETWPASAAVGSVPGWLVSAVVALYCLTMVAIAYRPRTWKGELLETEADAWERHGERRR
jgi:uncharacterized membrane protein